MILAKNQPNKYFTTLNLILLSLLEMLNVNLTLTKYPNINV